jgi:phosphoribosylanthranilate isomerase
MLVKICGITRLDDAEAAVDAGAAAIGFVFWPESPRFLDPYRARAIAAALPAFVTTVGVFVNQPIAYVRQVASLVHLGAVQLHGDEVPEYAAGLSTPILKAIAIGAGAGDRIATWPSTTMVLLDVHDPVKRGGTGQTIDWDAAAAIAATRRVFLAGGLTPANAADAAARVRPYGIDVSSGVERAPGIKDHRRLRALFEALHGLSHTPARS